MHNGSCDSMLPGALRHCRIFLLLSWVTGLIFGIAFSYSTETFSSLMRGVVQSPVSIVGLVAVIALPYLITAFAVFISRPGLLIPLAFCKAFLFGACAAGLDQSYFTAGWLIRMLLMFSDLACLPLLLWLWLGCLRADRKGLTGRMAAVMALSVLAGGIDCCLIAPFLASVI